MAYLTNFERLAIEKGMKQGLEQGEHIGMLRYARELVMDALEVKFGTVTEELQTKLQQIQEREVLRQLLRKAIIASSLEEFEKSVES